MFHDHDWWSPMWSPMLWFIWPAIVVIIVFAVLRSNTMRKDAPQAKETALDILKKRYARGELSKEEFEKMKQDLG